MPPVAEYALAREIKKSAEKARGSRVCRAAGRLSGAAPGEGALLFPGLRRGCVRGGDRGVGNTVPIAYGARDRSRVVKNGEPEQA
jgi:hypothetical protein